MIKSFQHKGLRLFFEDEDAAKLPSVHTYSDLKTATFLTSTIWTTINNNIMKRGMRPAHPGALIKETIEGLREETGHKYTLAEIAKGLGVTRKTLSSILNQHQGVSSEMCVRLSEAFGTSAEFWLDIQRNYDLWHAERTVERKTIQHFRPLQSNPLQSA